MTKNDVKMTYKVLKLTLVCVRDFKLSYGPNFPFVLHLIHRDTLISQKMHFDLLMTLK